MYTPYEGPDGIVIDGIEVAGKEWKIDNVEV